MSISRLSLGCLMALFCGIAVAQDNSTDAINEGWNLYYQANFTGATAILERVDRDLDAASGKQEDRIRAKLGLALCYMGQNRNPRAEDKFVEILLLDCSYTLDATQHPPKVIAAFNSAKPRAQRLICANLCAQSQQLVAAADINGLKELIKAPCGSCPCINDVVKDLARVLVDSAKQAYGQSQYSTALRAFQEAIQLDPGNMEAKTYALFCEEQIKIARQSLYLDWKSQVTGGRYDQAALSYQKIKLLEDDEAKALVVQMEQEYQRILADLVTSWKDACSKNDAARMKDALEKATAIDPGQGLNRSHLDQMKNCQPPPAPPPAAAASPPPTVATCLKISPVAYLQKMTKRVEPEYPAAARKNGIKGTVRMQIKVAPDGKVSDVDVLQGHLLLGQAAKEAVRQWEFKPTVLSGTPVCVITEIGVDFR